MVHTATNSVTTYFQYLCGHGALVSLPRIKGESPRTREHRIGIEKTAASQRRCDFCGPEPAVAVGLAELELPLGQEEVMTVPTTTEPTAASKGPGRDNGEASAEPKRRGPSPLRKLSDEQELELTRLYSDTETAVPEIARRFEVGESSVYRIAQRHGASLRTKSSPDGGATRRTRSSADGSVTSQPAAAAAPQPKRAAAPKATRSAAPRRAARSTAPSAAAATAAAATATKPRRAATRKQAVTVTARRRATRPASTTAASTSRTATGAQSRFRIVFRAETVITADTMRAAIAQAEARGATEITSIALAD
jgi:transposase-like protein